MQTAHNPRSAPHTPKTRSSPLTTSRRRIAAPWRGDTRRQRAPRQRTLGQRNKPSRQGRWCFGKTPMQTFLNAIPPAKAKIMAA
ncbi:MAG: hypothetical protein EA406_13735 [Rhodospirillales bacterium]|nr:MAG: hypothetical protein EA406_13735 [Rhodospirillales bacterium]